MNLPLLWANVTSLSQYPLTAWILVGDKVQAGAARNGGSFLLPRFHPDRALETVAHCGTTRPGEIATGV